MKSETRNLQITDCEDRSINCPKCNDPMNRSFSLEAWAGDESFCKGCFMTELNGYLNMVSIMLGDR